MTLETTGAEQRIHEIDTAVWDDLGLEHIYLMCVCPTVGGWVWTESQDPTRVRLRNPKMLTITCLPFIMPMEDL